LSRPRSSEKKDICYVSRFTSISSRPAVTVRLEVSDG
jgi:hypothetical protein